MKVSWVELQFDRQINLFCQKKKKKDRKKDLNLPESFLLESHYEWIGQDGGVGRL